MLATVAVLTMALGVVVALTQTDMKRMLAYCSIAHAGFILDRRRRRDAPAAPARSTSFGSMLFYLVAYGFATLGAFAVVTMVRDSGRRGARHLPAGPASAGRTRCWPASSPCFLLAFAGIPLTGGFIGKWAVFSAAWRGGYCLAGRWWPSRSASSPRSSTSG